MALILPLLQRNMGLNYSTAIKKIEGDCWFTCDFYVMVWVIYLVITSVYCDGGGRVLPHRRFYKDWAISLGHMRSFWRGVAFNLGRNLGQETFWLLQLVEIYLESKACPLYLLSMPASRS